MSIKLLSFQLHTPFNSSLNISSFDNVSDTGVSLCTIGYSIVAFLPLKLLKKCHTFLVGVLKFSEVHKFSQGFLFS